MASKCTVVNPWDWLNEDGSFLDEPRIRKRAIRVAQCIEYGGPLGRGETRETLIACRFRPGGEACRGLLWVLKQSDDAVLAFCAVCRGDDLLIYEWEDTPWADGPMAPVHVDDLARQAGKAKPTTRQPGPENISERLQTTLAILGSNLSADEGRARRTLH